MTLKFILPNSLYNCELQITDTKQTKRHRLLTPLKESDEPYVLELEIGDNEFDFTIIPVMVDKNEILDDIPQNTMKDRLARKAASALIASLGNITLLVGCKYHVSGVVDGDVIKLNQQVYGWSTAVELLFADMMPVTYSFFEASINGERLKPTGAFGTNRKKVLRMARMFTLLNLGLEFILLYPVQLIITRRQTRNRRVFKKLLRFHRMPLEKRQQYTCESKNS